MKKRVAKEIAKVYISETLVQFIGEDPDWHWRGGKLAASGFSGKSVLDGYTVDEQAMILEAADQIAHRLLKRL